MKRTQGLIVGTIMSILTVLLMAGPLCADVTVDNGATGTSYIGSWALSGGTSPYGSSSLWSRNGATYTFSMSGQASGIYEVFMWWSEWSTRSPAVPVAVQYTGGTANLTVNQLQNAGQWNSLGTFYFNGSGSVTITAAQGDTLSTCADAVEFRYISAAAAPVAMIDSINPSPAGYGESVTFTGHGTDSDGTITAYKWTSSLDGSLSSSKSFSTSALSSGTHTITFTVEDNDGLTSAGATSTLVVGAATEEVIIDNSDQTLTSRTGTWSVSSAPNYYLTGSVWARDGAAFTWKFIPTQSGTYNVSMWWTTTSTRSSSIPVQINSASGSQTVTINQLQNAGQWNSLGTFSFVAGVTYNMVMTAQPNPTSTCADAMKFTLEGVAPSAVIDSINPNPASYGEAVTFTGHGTGGSIAAYEWTSSIDGTIGTEASFSTTDLSTGTHTITFTVKDSLGSSSTGITATLVVGAAPDDDIIDNTDSRTSRSGTWSVSSSAGYYGTGSVWSRDGATFTWNFTPAETGYYQVMMWWTTTLSRSSAIPVTINYSGGSQVASVDQLKNASRWNILGAYPFNAGETYAVTITADAYPTSTCADAVMFRRASGAPTADFSAEPLTGSVPLTVYFTDLSGGIITSRTWDFGDGTTSSDVNPSHTYTTAGNYTVTLTVSNTEGSSTKSTAQYVNATGAEVEHIYVGDGYAEDAVFVPNVKVYLTEIGAIEDGGLWYYANTTTGKTYVFHFINTPSGFLSALKQTNAHIIWNGHSNFGMGGTFADAQEVYNQEIDTIQYIDDDRFTHISTPMVSLKVDGMQYGQAYPNWKPIFKDGTSGAMPYAFAEGTPPYNYYLTYKVPGDSTIYRIELADGSYLQRFPDSGFPAWYSSSGAAPTPAKNPQYFIVNNDSDYSRCDFTGTWPAAEDSVKDYRSYNYQYHDAGTGLNSATWTLVVKHAGNYQVIATWHSSSANASNAKYTIQYTGGTSVVEADQRVRTTGRLLGTFYFAKGVYTVTLTDDADGRVVADSIRLRSTDGYYIVAADNGYHYKPHFYNSSYAKTIVYGNTAVTESELKYSRMFYSSCNSCNYYCGTFHRGIMYCTTSDSSMYTGLVYIRDYLLGMSDNAILEDLNTYQNIHELINFNLKPPSLR